MPPITWKFKYPDNYSVQYNAGQPAPSSSDATVVIYLNQGETRVGLIRVYEDGATLQPPSFSAEVIGLNYHMRHYPHLIDMLRNEKPLTLKFDDKNGVRTGYVFVGREPIGEGE